MKNPGSAPVVDGCSSPSAVMVGSVNTAVEFVGAMSIFQCDAGHMPQDEVTSTCLHSGRWGGSPSFYCVPTQSSQLLASIVKYY